VGLEAAGRRGQGVSANLIQSPRKQWAYCTMGLNLLSFFKIIFWDWGGRSFNPLTFTRLVGCLRRPNDAASMLSGVKATGALSQTQRKTVTLYLAAGCTLSLRATSQHIYSAGAYIYIYSSRPAASISPLESHRHTDPSGEEREVSITSLPFGSLP